MGSEGPVRGREEKERKGWEGVGMEVRGWEKKRGKGKSHLATLRESLVLTCPKLYPDPVGVAEAWLKLE